MSARIFVSGQVGRDEKGDLFGPGDVRAQTEQAFKNIKLILEAAGSGMHKVGKVTVLITRLEYRPIVQEIRARVFKEAGHLPASTLAIVDSLALPEWLVAACSASGRRVPDRPPGPHATAKVGANPP